MNRGLHGRPTIAVTDNRTLISIRILRVNLGTQQRCPLPRRFPDGGRLARRARHLAMLGSQGRPPAGPRSRMKRRRRKILRARLRRPLVSHPPHRSRRLPNGRSQHRKLLPLVPKQVLAGNGTTDCRRTSGNWWLGLVGLEPEPRLMPAHWAGERLKPIVNLNTGWRLTNSIALAEIKGSNLRRQPLPDFAHPPPDPSGASPTWVDLLLPGRRSTMAVLKMP